MKTIVRQVRKPTQGADHAALKLIIDAVDDMSFDKLRNDHPRFANMTDGAIHQLAEDLGYTVTRT